ncbi:DUF2059 domain-containing protein [Hyphobacterium sp. HN65]|uniref:DUF2059 domain-containing protein n=1 Tax=Hyphobacterium lacteum TaxID=3116575 RepID=A0ABU7LT45_9PROT|nr:DUF2059 domain-containing protein [Hyphobacterium sp. HN65]MEE2527096.1 DUF2059 domain-containing protein [Hyphobacterium sp. HN65]
MKLFTSLVFAVSMLATAPALHAQDRHHELAVAVVQESGAEEMMIELIGSMGPLLTQSFRASIPDLTEPEGDRIMEFFLDEIRVLMPEFINDVAEIYVEHFTEEELEDILSFFRSSTGQKLNSLQPVLSSQGQVIGERLGEQAMMNAMPRITELLENR